VSDDLLGRRTEGETLDRLLTQAKSGSGQVLVLRGEAGIGKTALLDHVSARAAGFRVTRAAGVEAESAFPYAGLHQLCVPFLDRLEKLPAPQREALGTAFGMAAGPRPTRFMVGLAVLTLLAEVADEQPLVCLVDDAQWLDSMSSAVLGFVARRLLAERIALVFVLREGNDYLDGLPELFVRGLDDADARALLESVIKGPVDGRVRDRIVAEARGNPLALLELPREAADGLDPGPLTSRIEQSFVRQIEPLPSDTRLLLLTAAAEPLGDATLLWRAAGLLGLGADPAAAAVGTGLIEFGARVQFRHPLVRSAVYRSASAVDRQRVHRALADVTDQEIDPDRRAWHRAQSTTSPDEQVAADLENSASRAQARGGLLAAAAFLEQAAVLTPSSQPHGPSATRALWTRPCACSRPSKPVPRTTGAAPRSSTCAATSPSTSVASPRRHPCCSTRPSDSPRSTPTWPAKPIWKRCPRRSGPARRWPTQHGAHPRHAPRRARSIWCSRL
jgi:hypothetical protein